MEKKAVIEFDHFSFQYFSQAAPTLHDMNLTIYEGEKVLIVGPSGSGKSTMDIASMVWSRIPIREKCREVSVFPGKRQPI